MASEMRHVHLPVAGDEGPAPLALDGRAVLACHGQFPDPSASTMRPGQLPTLEVLQRRAAAGADVAVGGLVEAELTHGGRRVPAAHDGQPVDRGHGLRDAAGALLERRELEDTHGPVPEDGARLDELGREQVDRERTHVQPHQVVRDRIGRSHAGGGIGSEPVGADDVDGQHDLLARLGEQRSAGVHLVFSRSELPTPWPCAARNVKTCRRRWATPPFEPTLVGDDLYARGASDDKGQTFIHAKAIEALLATTGRLPLNVKLLIEGEEEFGGETIEAYVKSHQTELACDAVLISDTHILSPSQPSIIYGLRGMWAAEITVTTARRDLHSGSFGGAVHNANQALVELLAALHDAEGRVAVPGFYEQVRVQRQTSARRWRVSPMARPSYWPKPGPRPPGASRDLLSPSALARGPRWSSTVCGAASPATASRPSSLTRRTARSAVASCPTKTRP